MGHEVRRVSPVYLQAISATVTALGHHPAVSRPPDALQPEFGAADCPSACYIVRVNGPWYPALRPLPVKTAI
jgi:hypothetical protein